MKESQVIESILTIDGRQVKSSLKYGAELMLASQWTNLSILDDGVIQCDVKGKIIIFNTSVDWDYKIIEPDHRLILACACDKLGELRMRNLYLYNYGQSVSKSWEWLKQVEEERLIWIKKKDQWTW